MRSATKPYAVIALAAAVLILHRLPAAASTTPRWSVGQLARSSDAIVVGRVASISSGWDDSSDAIYTYVSVDVSEVIKGAVPPGRITIKQLGGAAGEIGLRVFDQAAFTTGEEVLLFLEMRPRDRTLYTTALAQGKWRISRLAGGTTVARRDAESQPLALIRDAAAYPRPSSPAARVDVNPSGASSSQPFTLMTTPYLYTFFPAIDVQAGGQNGLAGGGIAEIQAAASQWSAAGSTFRYTIGSTAGPARCANQFLSSYRVTISFLDPCGEISNNGATLAIGGSYFSNTASTTVGGRSFRLALEGFVINNDSSVALQFLRQSGCFHNIQLHELGHVLGLGHSTDTAAIMFPSINSGCSAGPSGLAPDDLRGVQIIYPLSGSASTPVTGLPGQSTITRASEEGEILTVEWIHGLGAAPTTHRLDFTVDATGQLISLPVGATPRVEIPVPSGTRGTFSVRVTPFNDSLPGPASAAFAFAIGLGVSCTGPPSSPNVSGLVSGGTAVVGWPPVAGATHYLLQAGTTPGGSDLVPLTSLGAATGASASEVPTGFTAWVRVVAASSCGLSAPTDFFLQ